MMDHDMKYVSDPLNGLSVDQILQVFRQEGILKKVCAELLQKDSLTGFYVLLTQSEIRLESEEVKLIRLILAKGPEAFDSLEWWRGWIPIH